MSNYFQRYDKTYDECLENDNTQHQDDDEEDEKPERRGGAFGGNRNIGYRGGRMGGIMGGGRGGYLYRKSADSPWFERKHKTQGYGEIKFNQAPGKIQRYGESNFWGDASNANFKYRMNPRDSKYAQFVRDNWVRASMDHMDGGGYVNRTKNTIPAQYVMQQIAKMWWDSGGPQQTAKINYENKRSIALAKQRNLPRTDPPPSRRRMGPAKAPRQRLFDPAGYAQSRGSASNPSGPSRKRTYAQGEEEEDPGFVPSYFG
jgi:hypothetical protein